MKVKIFTMVKNEEDIIEYWINYHGSIFGYRNLYVVDNYSDDGTYEKILKYKKVGVNIYREKDYTQKGKLIEQLIKRQKNYEIAIPLDIDEFISHYDKTNNCLNPTHTKEYIDNSLKLDNTVFKCNYVQSLISEDNKNGYDNALLQTEYGKYEDYGKLAKTFFNVKMWKGELDHGNHYQCDDYILTDMVLVHYHCRNLDQMKKKVRTNIVGLGYPESIDQLKKIYNDNNDVPGSHHIKHMINILSNKFNIPLTPNINDKYPFIKLNSLVNFFLKLAITK